jgi:hypothetical protein
MWKPEEWTQLAVSSWVQFLEEMDFLIRHLVHAYSEHVSFLLRS